MSEPETFVARWLRLKREAGQAAEEPREPAPAADVAACPESAQREKREGADEPAFDPASLPSVESITAHTDIRDFLRSGVPPELTKAALRQVWTADPAIRDFIGIAENQWDFTDPAAIPGFGPLQATDNVGELVARAIGKARDTAERLAQGPSAGEQEVGRVDNLRAAEQPPPATAAQDVGSPVEKDRRPLEGEGAGGEQSAVNAAMQDNPGPVRSAPFSKRRGHGSALPQ